MPNRRTFLATLSASGLFFAERGAFAQALTLTPAQTEGPYYPNRLPLDQDNDLLLLNDNITPAVGTVAWLGGRIFSATGSPVRNALIEIWQADNAGSYIHTNGALNGQRDGNFQGYGRFVTASDGAYLFRTIKPGLYPGRVRHVHAKITVPGGPSLTTQLYIEGETGNDGVLNGITNAAQRASVIRPWSAIPNSPIGALAVTWDIYLNFTAAEPPAATRPTLFSSAAISNGANLRDGAASGAWITIQGAGLASSTRTWRAADFNGNRLPESLDGVSVRINNQPASVYFISPTQINALAPEAISDGSVPVVVTTANGSSDPASVNFTRFAPGFFQFPQENAAAIRAADAALIGPPQLIDGATTVGATPGETILLYGTGFGPTSPATIPHETFSGPRPTANPVRIQIHNQFADVAFAGLISPGLYQFNVRVPDLVSGDYPVTAEVGGVRTAKFVKLRISP